MIDELRMYMLLPSGSDTLPRLNTKIWEKDCSNCRHFYTGAEIDIFGCLLNGPYYPGGGSKNICKNYESV